MFEFLERLSSNAGFCTLICNWHWFVQTIKVPYYEKPETVSFGSIGLLQKSVNLLLRISSESDS